MNRIKIPKKYSIIEKILIVGHVGRFKLIKKDPLQIINQVVIIIFK